MPKSLPRARAGASHAARPRHARPLWPKGSAARGQSKQLMRAVWDPSLGSGPSLHPPTDPKPLLHWGSQGCQGSSPLAQGGLSWPFRAPKILVIPVPPQIPSPGALLGALGTQNPAQRDRSPARICGHQPQTLPVEPAGAFSFCWKHEGRQTPCAHTPLRAASPHTTGEKAICVHWRFETSIHLTTAGAGGFLPPPLLFKKGGNKLAKHRAH